MPALYTLGWLLCSIYSTIPSFWLMIHPRASYWRSRRTSPYRILIPVWIMMWAIAAAMTALWRHIQLYDSRWSWIPAAVLFLAGLWLYKKSGANFSPKQLIGLPELRPHHPETLLVTSGIRSRVRHPVYLAHLCEMLAWSLGTGLAVCFALTAFAILTGAIMIRKEDAELEQRFREQYAEYRRRVPATFPMIYWKRGATALLASIIVFLAYAYATRNRPMLYQHGAPEDAGETAYSIMNPFRDRTSENTAERLIRDLHSAECERIVLSLNSDPRICPLIASGGQGELVWREDRELTRDLVYDLSPNHSRLWVHFAREEGGFGVRSISLTP